MGLISNMRDRGFIQHSKTDCTNSKKIFDFVIYNKIYKFIYALSLTKFILPSISHCLIGM